MKIICVGRNYIDHAKELNNPVPEEPLIFIKPSTALLIDEKPLYHPDFTQNIHHEIELVVKIAKNGKKIQKDFAPSYYEEIGLGIDFTARDVQDRLKAKGQPWEKAKGFDHSACVGGFVHKDTLGSISDIKFHLDKNGVTVQKGVVSDMIFDIDTLICHVSEYFTLQKGDLIFTGTPAGVGPIAIGDKMVGYLNEAPLLQCEIK